LILKGLLQVLGGCGKPVHGLNFDEFFVGAVIKITTTGLVAGKTVAIFTKSRVLLIKGAIIAPRSIPTLHHLSIRRRHFRFLRNVAAYIMHSRYVFSIYPA